MLNVLLPSHNHFYNDVSCFISKGNVWILEWYIFVPTLFEKEDQNHVLTYTRVPTTNSTHRHLNLQCKNSLCVFYFDKAFCNKMLQQWIVITRHLFYWYFLFSSISIINLVLINHFFYQNQTKTTIDDNFGAD